MKTCMVILNLFMFLFIILVKFSIGIRPIISKMFDLFHYATNTMYTNMAVLNKLEYTIAFKNVLVGV